MKRIIGAIVAGVVVFSGIYALAASLNVNSQSLGAGVSVTAACTSETLTASYTVGSWSYSPTYSGYPVSSVTVTDTGNSNNLLGGSTAGGANNCNSKVGGTQYTAEVTVYDASHAVLGSGTQTTPATGNSFTVALTGVDASQVAGVAVVISG